MRRKFRLLFLAALAAFLTATGDSAQGSRLILPAGQVDRFIDYFDTLALTADYGPFNHRPAWIRKWTGPVNVVIGTGAMPFRQRIEQIFDRVSGLTGMPFKVVSEEAALHVTFDNVITVKVIEPKETARQFLSDDIVCQTETHGLGGALHTAFVVVGRHYPDCLKHEIMHVLGFDAHWRPSESSSVRSVLAMRDSPVRSEDFSRWDEMAIKLLYHQRLAPGMSRKTGLQIARELIDGDVQRAALTRKAQPSGALPVTPQ